jgi:glycosyltransferase involved in cell wall biosynthesis
MKIAILSRNFSRISGGAESYAVQLAHAMRTECEITVISQSFDESRSHFHHIAVPKLPFKSRWINQLWFNWYSRKVSTDRFDIVHSHENVTHGNIHTVHVKTVHTSLAQKGMTRLRIMLSPRLLCYLWLEKKRLCTKGHRNIFVSELLMQETVAFIPGVDSAIFIPPGVTLPDHNSTLNQKSKARRNLGLAEDSMVIGFVGHDFKKKGLDTLLKALALLPFKADLLVVGKPAQTSRYKDLVQSLGYGKACHFLGVVRDMSQIYLALDALAHPTTQDVFPMTLLEAMAFEVPVVTTMPPYNSMASLLVNGTDALLITDPYDCTALAASLSEIWTSPELRKSLIKNGLSFAQKYSWSSVKERYYQIYREAIADRSDLQH